VVMDDGLNIFFSKLGNDFEFFQEKMNEMLGGMYEMLVNDVLKEVFPEYHATTLLKLAYKMKGGKAVSLKDIQKMDQDLAVTVDNFIFEEEGLKEKTKIFQDLVDEYGVYYGIAQDRAVKESFIKWIMFAIPEKNVVCFSILPRWKQGGEEDTEEQKQYDMFFFKIIMERGSPSEKVEDKVREIDQALVVLDFVKDPCYMDKRELRHSPYQYAIRKLPFLRILRKSYLGKVSSTDTKEWNNEVKEIFKSATLQ